MDRKSQQPKKLGILSTNTTAERPNSRVHLISSAAGFGSMLSTRSTTNDGLFGSLQLQPSCAKHRAANEECARLDRVPLSCIISCRTRVLSCYRLRCSWCLVCAAVRCLGLGEQGPCLEVKGVLGARLAPSSQQHAPGAERVIVQDAHAAALLVACTCATPNRLGSYPKA